MDTKENARLLHPGSDFGWHYSGWSPQVSLPKEFGSLRSLLWAGMDSIALEIRSFPNINNEIRPFDTMQRFVGNKHTSWPLVCDCPACLAALLEVL